MVNIALDLTTEEDLLMIPMPSTTTFYTPTPDLVLVIDLAQDIAAIRRQG